MAKESVPIHEVEGVFWLRHTYLLNLVMIRLDLQWNFLELSLVKQFSRASIYRPIRICCLFSLGRFTCYSLMASKIQQWGAEAVAQFLRWLIHKHEDLGSVPRTPLKCLAWWRILVISALGR